jgi:hypothetical protein
VNKSDDDQHYWEIEQSQEAIDNLFKSGRAEYLACSRPSTLPELQRARALSAVTPITDKRRRGSIVR